MNRKDHSVRNRWRNFHINKIKERNRRMENRESDQRRDYKKAKWFLY